MRIRESKWLEGDRASEGVREGERGWKIERGKERKRKRDGER